MPLSWFSLHDLMMAVIAQTTVNSIWQEQEELHHFCLVAKKCDPMGCSSPDSFVHRIFEVRILEWLTTSFSRGPCRPWDWTYLSCIGRWVFFLSFLTTEPSRRPPASPYPIIFTRKEKCLFCGNLNLFTLISFTRFLMHTYGSSFTREGRCLP